MESVSMKKCGTLSGNIKNHNYICTIVFGCRSRFGCKESKIGIISFWNCRRLKIIRVGWINTKMLWIIFLANMSTTQEQIDNLQKYCDSSIYMNIDPLNVNVASVQYRILMSDGSDTQGNSSVANEKSADIMNELTAYVKNGDWKVAAEEELSDVPVEYLSEVVGSTSTGNIFYINSYAL